MDEGMLEKFLVQSGAHILEARVVSFGNTVAEYQALESAVVVPLLGHAALRVTGDDRLDFVHGQVSNEVKRLKTDTLSQNLMLNYKGHALAQLNVFRREDDLFLAIEGGAGAFVERELKAHIVFDQVEVQNVSNQITSVSVQGSKAAQVLTSLTSELPTGIDFIQLPFASGKLLIHAARRSKAGGFDIHVLTRDAELLMQALLDAGAMLAGEKALTLSRIEALIPYAETEAGDGILPQECGLDYCVSYRKGCYLGQEIMARIEARGNLRRSLKGLRLSGMPVRREVLAKDKTVGQLGAVAEHPEFGVIALVILRNDIENVTHLTASGFQVQPFTS
jgi:folate-binding protein YgfZ